MKKIAFLALVLMMGFCGNLSAAITANLTTSAITVSTAYPAYYEVKLQLQCSDNLFCSGLFTFNVERKLVSDLTWSSIILYQPFPADTSHDGLYLNYGYALQTPGTQYMYQVKVTYGGGCPVLNKTSNYVTCQGAKPDFTLGTAGTTYPNQAGPINLCMFANAYINTGSCELESFYYIGLAECDLWWGTSGNYDWGHWYSGAAPNVNRKIQDEVDAHVDGFTAAPFPSKTLMSGNITYGPKAGTGRYYRLTVATGEPSWFTKSALIRIDDTCRMTVVETRDTAEIPTEAEFAKISLYPNPVKDNLTINLDANQLITNVSLFDINKIQVKSEKFDGKRNEVQVNVSALKKGLYFIAVETTTGVIRNKIVKE